MICNILVVDDDSFALNLLEVILTADGYKVYPFNNGEQALRSIMLEVPELILLDIRMPGMDGFELCRRIKEVERLKEIPVIFISAASDIEDKISAFQEGGVDYITKPFQKEEVIARVKTHIALSQQMRNQHALLNAIQETTFLMERNGTILVINEVGARRLNAKPEELGGKNVYEILPPKVAQSREEKFEQIAQSGKLGTMEDERDGHCFLSSIYPVFDSKGEVILPTFGGHSKKGISCLKEVSHGTQRIYKIQS